MICARRVYGIAEFRCIIVRLLSSAPSVRDKNTCKKKWRPLPYTLGVLVRESLVIVFRSEARWLKPVRVWNYNQAGCAGTGLICCYTNTILPLCGSEAVIFVVASGVLLCFAVSTKSPSLGDAKCLICSCALRQVLSSFLFIFDQAVATCVHAMVRGALLASSQRKALVLIVYQASFCLPFGVH